ncbi:MAG: hypothetical protein QXO01_03285 [Nitrososphaerota archaeon]
MRITATFPGTNEYSSSIAVSIGELTPTAKILATLAVSPESFKVNAGEKITLTATLKDVEGNVLSGKTITWNLEGLGKLSSTTGTSIDYIAPEEVSKEVIVKIKASFAGDEKYTMSSALVIGRAVPTAVVMEEEYVMNLDRALLKNLKIEGPLTFAGRSVMKIVADGIEASDFSVTHVGISAESASIMSVEIYATNLKAYSPELGKTIEITGEDKVSLGPYDVTTFEGATIRFVHLSAKTGHLVNVKVVGEHVGGVEPYIPILIHTPKVELSEGYALIGPQSYEELKGAVHSFTVGKGIITDLALILPIEYSLDRENNNVEFVPKWTATASKATLTELM